MNAEEKTRHQYFFHEGTEVDGYRYFGCHREDDRWVFRVFAPGAHRVFVTGDFCDWGEGAELWRTPSEGIFEGYPDGVKEGNVYQYRLVTPQGEKKKADPYARRAAAGGALSVVLDELPFPWRDGAYMRTRKEKCSEFLRGSYPMWVYEVHPASLLRRWDDGYATWDELAEYLTSYTAKMGYTHVELMGVAEYPFDGSWGYQVGAYYAPTSRHGTPEDFRRFVEKLHLSGVGVLLDWVPAHFPTDPWGLAEFDGSRLYEYREDEMVSSPSWGTRFFDLGRAEVRSFLLSNALYWLREFHVDGLRMDAVAATLYLDYDRAEGTWRPNEFGDNRNLSAVDFWQRCNTAVHREFPDVLTVAEESTAWRGITAPPADGGLGFSLKWNMGWANDLFRYLGEDPVYRRFHHAALNFPMLYAYDERFLLPVSHDEVVHGKGSLIGKANGNYEDKFRQIRAFLLFMATFPGKKMTFMGCEFGQFAEWDHRKEIDWFLLDYDSHRQLQEYSAALGALYRGTPALWERDFERDGFTWVEADAADGNYVVFYRASSRDRVLVAVSFSGASQTVRLPSEYAEYRVLFRTDGDAPGKVPGGGEYVLPPFGGAVFLPLSRS